jgi:hypothetical protein
MRFENNPTVFLAMSSTPEKLIDSSLCSDWLFWILLDLLEPMNVLMVSLWAAIVYSYWGLT